MKDLWFLSPILQSPHPRILFLSSPGDFPNGSVVQWLRLRIPNSGSLGSIPGQGTRSHMPQLRGLHASAKDLAQPNKEKYFFKKRGAMGDNN